MKIQRTKEQRFRLRQKPAEGYLTVNQAAQLLNVSTRSIHRYVHSYGLPAKKPGGIWIIKKADLEEWVKKNGSFSG